MLTSVKSKKKFLPFTNTNFEFTYNKNQQQMSDDFWINETFDSGHLENKLDLPHWKTIFEEDPTSWFKGKKVP